MLKRNLAVLATLALFLASCGGNASDDASTTTSNADPEVTADLPDEVLLSYTLKSGDVFVYDVDLSQTIQLTAEGSSGELSDEEIPGSANIELDAEGVFTYEVNEGPEPGTFEITITGELTDVSATGDVDGEPIDQGEIPEFASLDPVETTVVVDEQGNIVPSSSDELDPFADMFGGMSALEGGFPGQELGQFFGPPFNDEEVTVGSTWSSTVEIPGFDDEPIVTNVQAEVTGTDVVGGAEVFVIESNATTSPIEFDLGQFFIGMMTAFAPEDPTPEEQVEIDALIENLRFVISIDETVANTTTYFDAEAGLSRQFSLDSSANIGMDMNFPDEESGELAGFVMDMSISQIINHSLTTGPSA